jgi:hypothetical protein
MKLILVYILRCFLRLSALVNGFFRYLTNDFCVLFYDAVSTSNGKMADKLERISKKEVVA